MMTTKTTLPAGWHWAKLGDVCQTTSGGTPQRGNSDFYGGRIPWVKSGELNDGLITSTEETITEMGLKNSSAKLFPAGTLVIALYGATVGKLGILNMEAATNQAVCAIFTSESVHRDFLFFYLRGKRDDLLEISFGGAQPNISQEIVRSIEIPLPPLDEQRRLAALLTKQMAAVAQARQAAETQLRAARELPSAYLRDVFEGQEAKKWPKQRLADVSQIVSGITLGRKLFDVKTRKVPYLRVANVKDGFLDLSDVYNIDATDADIAKCSLKYGDLLLTEGGDRDKLGRGTFWEEQIPECLHQNHIFRVRFSLDKISAGFMAYQIGSPYGKAYFLAHAKQTTGIATINQKVLGNFPLLIPPFGAQEKIAHAIKEKLAETESLKQSLESQLAAIHQLPSALLRRAFSGQI
jgi:type I restriction enzyme, S subunit